METNLEFLLSEASTPLFWKPERLDQQSAWWGHVPFAFWITSACRPKVLVELGTHHGVSYAAFCEAVMRQQLTCRCYAVDTWAGDAHAGYYGDEVYNELKIFHDARYGAFSSLLRTSFDEACGQFSDGTIDLLHIDGYHTYDAVRHDFEAWRPKLSGQGILLVHDTNERNADFGVWRLFGELASRFPAFEFLHCHGLGVVCVGNTPPSAVMELCRLNDAKLAIVRDRFSFLGARWSEPADAAVEKAHLLDRLARAEAQQREQHEQRVQIAEKQVRSIERRISIAKIPLAKDLDDFTFTGTPVNEALVRDLAGGNLLADRRNLVVVGGSPPARRTWPLRSRGP